MVQRRHAVQAVIISSTVVLTVALLVLIVYAIRALNQLTRTIRNLDLTLERSARTMDNVDQILEGVRERLGDLERVAATVNAAHEFVTTLGGGVLRRASQPAMSVAGVALAAMKGVETFMTYRRKSKEGNGHE
jgi:uncharacterized protein YoxC